MSTPGSRSSTHKREGTQEESMSRPSKSTYSTFTPNSTMANVADADISVLDRRETGAGEYDSAPSLAVKFSGVTLTAILFQLLGGSIFGYNLGVIAGALRPLDITFGADTVVQQAVTAAMLGGAMVGSFASGSLCDILGRRKVALAFSILSVGGTAFLSFAWSIWAVVLARFVVGLAVGGFSFVCPMYASEISPPAIRGILSSIIQLALAFSAFVAYLMNLAFQDMQDGWRYMFAVGGVPCLLILVISLRMEESPRWLVLNKREDDARPILAQVVGEKNVEEVIDAILDSKLQEAENSTAGWSEVFSRGMLRHLTIGFVLAVGIQMTGNNAVTFYAPKIFEQVGWDSGSVSVAITAGIGFWKFVCQSIVIFSKLHDRYGRRFMYLSGVTVMGSGALLLGICFFVLDDDLLAYMAIFAIAIFTAGFQMGPGPLFYVLMSEIFPDSIRGRAMSFTNALQWFFNLALAISFVSVMEAIGGGPSFMMFSGVAVFVFASFYVLCPETMGKTLDEIQIIMSQPILSFRSHKKSPSLLNGHA